MRLTTVGEYRTLAQIGMYRPVPAPVPEHVSMPMMAEREQGLGLPTPGSMRGVGRPTGILSFEGWLQTGQQLLDAHPRDPALRFESAARQARLEREATAESAEQPAREAPGGADAEERSAFARGAVYVGMGGGALQAAIDVGRLIVKYPEAIRAAKFDPTLGRLGRLPTALSLTAMTRVDNRIVDPLAPRVATAASMGKSFTRFDEIAMKTSVLLGASLSGVQIAASIPNLVDALRKDGPWHENLTQSTSGRAGVMQLGGGLFGATLFGLALKQTAGSGATGLIPRLLAAGQAPIITKPIFGQIGIGIGLLTMANEVGYLDFLNRDETRSTGQVLRDAAHKTPVLNHPEFRTAALLGAGGVVGFKAHRAIAAAGGLKGLGTGHVIGGAIVAGLLGAQLLGGLKVLDKPD